ncbi:unnamed protein product [Rotaria sp. Silwood1]|nr:unnamed protein product [Rotaria sp. Silwood1]CAF1026177.1 unnamed protein product [Rotaria sp. Silwood1]CAF3422908.1 unnamed protein product [Rotaria sp. Silwood1]CAF3423316.1 unnamed protein product [Rotaria sp. Silwood1]CAF4657179.1 unnamed protein product [Rotaria sp. Silwood1]
MKQWIKDPKYACFLQECKVGPYRAHCSISRLIHDFTTPSSLLAKFAAAELSFVYHSVHHGYSFVSQSCTGDLVKKVFDESNIGQQISYGKTKARNLSVNDLGLVRSVLEIVEQPRETADHIVAVLRDILRRIMDPDAYSGSVNSVLPSSLHTVNNETRSSNRRYHHKKRHNDDVPSSLSVPVVSTDSQDERIEVKILPQDDNWGETTTITCNGVNEDTLTNNNDTTLQLNDNHHNEHLQYLSNNVHQRKLSITISQFIIYLICLIAFISPIFFLILPYILLTSDFLLSIDDYSPILTIIFKLIFLFFGTFLLLYRRRNRTYLPCIHIHKTCLILILSILLVVYWCYYIYKILKSKIDKYEEILSMTSTYEDLLLFILILSVLILEVKWLYPKWIVKVVRSPDGQIRQYAIGSMSIQEASVYLLEQYYKDFPVFNPWLENAHQTQAKRHRTFSTKSIGSQSNSSTIAVGTNGNTTRSMRGFNDRFYDELDYERRVRKRRTKLIISCEDAFTHVRKCLDEKYGSHIPMDAREAAQVNIDL